MLRNVLMTLLTATSLLQPARSLAQSYYIEDPKLFTGGLILGGNFAQVDGDQIAGYHKVGLNVGGIVYVNVHEHVSISLEILYSQKGSRMSKAQLTATGMYITDYRINLNYAEIPVMVNFMDKRKSSFGAGFSYSRLATSGENMTTTPSQVFNPDDYPFKKGDLNFISGGSLHLWKGLFVNLRFQYSLISIRDKVPQSTEKGAQFNNLWAVRLMYLFK